MTITYMDADKQLSELKEEYNTLGKEIEKYYLKPGMMIKVPGKLNALIDKENVLSREIKASNLNPTEIITLRQKYQEVKQAYKEAQDITTVMEKQLLGMQSKEQREQTAKLKEQIMQPVQRPKITRMIVETTINATEKTHKVLKQIMFPSFKGSKEYKNGEITVNLEEEV